jgi:acyl-CoA dehydrogenase
MVDFTLTDEQKSLREMAHDFAVKEMRPVAWEYDKDGTWPGEIIEKAWELGLMNSHIEEEYGGAGAGYLDGCLIEEELSWGCSGIQTSLGCNGLATAPISLGGSEETKKKYLGMLTEAPKLASFCLTEPDAGSDVSGMRTTAVKKGDKYVINGSKCFITNGGYADYYTVYAKTDKDAGHRGISAFVVERDWGVVVDKKEDKLGQRASNTATISFNDVEVPAENLLGEIEAARLLTWKSASMLDNGERNTLVSSHAKRFAADTAMKVATEAVQVYGGYGFIKEYPVEKLFRDAKIMQLYEGTSQIQRLVIARETLLPRRVEEPTAVPA